ncbi:redox-sensitive transcriptional activator SoxR [Alteromonas sp. KUL49]|uniref:redox-sensitive transcriptional activator SoxR n=1 Tax=Alteromonas sp. KUL49 TaxID=2480798 RepID=UPI00102EE542|nr:redox-sensitive transcriptional activator SoxR [Alteromonas sp. KUL49]TAP35877.1 redox-sensitive transcriptional activator SoxR [Alteromonas sp. KUL49]GEA13262.1 redox-sensitive transcriptional activator SoxR [Alteromonas sp. KUL49]
MGDRELSVGRVAERCGVKVSTLHFYEQKGLIKSLRNQGNQRRYKPDVLRRVSIIKAAQKMGITLDEIKEALSALPNNRTPNKNDWERMAMSWQAALTLRIDKLTRLKDSMTGCIGCGCLSMDVCPIYNPGDRVGQQHTGPVFLDNSGE